MTPSFALEASSSSNQQEAEIARRLQLLESRFMLPQSQRQQQQQNHSDLGKGTDFVNQLNNTSNNSNMTSNSTILLLNADGSQHSFSFDPVLGYSSAQKENIVEAARSNHSISAEKQQQHPQHSESYKLVEKAAHMHMQKVIDENNILMARSNGSSGIVLESPTASFPGSDHYCSSSAEDERKSISGVPNTSAEVNHNIAAIATTEDSRPPLATVNISGKGRKSVPMKRNIVSVTDGTTKPVSEGKTASSTTTLITSNNESSGRAGGGVRKRTRLQYPQLAIQSAYTTAGSTMPDVVDSSAANITPTNTNNNKREANPSGSAFKQEKNNSPSSPAPTANVTVPLEPSSSSRSNPPHSSLVTNNKATTTNNNKKSGPPPNNTTIHDFFKSSVKAQRSPLRAGSIGNTPPKNKTSSSPSPTSPPDIGTYGKSPHSRSVITCSAENNHDTIQQIRAQVDELRTRCEALEQIIKEKDEQLEVVHSNRSILHASLKSALEKKEQEMQQMRRTMDERVGALEKVLEQYILKDKSLELKALRQSLASNAARLGRFVYTRTLHGTIESWESGEAMAALKRQREELKVKRDVLEQRQKDAKRVSKRVMKEQQVHTITDSMPPPAPVATALYSNGESTVVGGLLVQDELDAMEAEESVRMHLNTIKQQEIKLAEEEKALNAETAAHIRSLKRLANEDSSRFQKVPKLNDRYTLLRLLGKGGFSEVWEAYDSEKLREVAVKIHQIDPRWSEAKRENYTKHVSREYQIHRDVRHPRIVSLYDVFEIDSNSFATVLECCKGTDLDTLLREKKTLPERDARAILLQILDGMRYLSSPSADGSRQGIIHYDLKPGNILFDEFGDAKITDFGLSKIVDAADPAESMELTSQGAGTYWYLPPECFITNQSVRISNKVDVWSIGVIYYQMLFGARPFGDGMSQEKVLCNHTMLNAREVKFPPKPTVSNECMEFIQLCLTYDQAFRPTIAELCNSKYLFQKKL